MPVKGQAGVLPQIGACRTLEVMGEAKAVRRQRVAELRRAVIAAHPDHGGTAESLRVALAALRAEQRWKAEAPPPTPPRAAQRPHRPSRQVVLDGRVRQAEPMGGGLLGRRSSAGGGVPCASMRQ